MTEARVGCVPGELLARHVQTITADAGWPVQAAAAQAILRRWSFAKRDDLTIEARPTDGRVLGDYQTARRGASTRPYHSRVSSIDPIDVSCNCADFLRNSLRVCKHTLIVLENIHARPTLRKQAEVAKRPVVTLTWNSVRPLTGAEDWLARVRWVAPAKATVAERRLAAHFSGDGQASPLADTHGQHPQARFGLVQDLLRYATRRPDRCDPALATKLENEQLGLKQAVALASRHQALVAAAATVKRALYPYQREGVARFLERGRLLLADDMGLGKTAQAIASCHALWTEREVRRGLIAVPASLKFQWHREWVSFTNAPVEVVHGSPAERRGLFEQTRRGFLIINYELVVRDLALIQAWAPDVIVLDEAQRIKNWATKTAGTIKRLTPKFRLVLTGTPMENRIEELASVLEWIDPFALEPSWRISPLHSVRVDGTKDVAGIRHLDTLRARIAPSMLRRVRQEVLAQLPPRTDTVIGVPMTDAQAEEHDLLKRPIARLVQMSQHRPLTQAEFLKLMTLLQKQRMICNGMALHDFEQTWPELKGRLPTDSVLQSLCSPKLLELRELVQSVVVDQGRRIVIFSQWRRMLQLAQWTVADLLTRAGKRSVFFTGQEKLERRTHNVVDFHDDPATAILFATDAGGVGLNLQHAANCCINLELPWNPAVLEQRIGRIYRLGQSDPVQVYNLVSESGIESRIADLVGNKQAFFAGLFDQGSDEVSFDKASGFLKRLEATVDDSDAEASDTVDGDDMDELPVTHEAAPQEPTPTVVPITFAQATSQLRVQAHADGSLSIHAPQEAAAALAGLLQSLATSLLRSAQDNPRA
jgi:superfamily II DNA or RNA helicase